jgi:hypothetical protein
MSVQDNSVSARLWKLLGGIFGIVGIAGSMLVLTSIRALPGGWSPVLLAVPIFAAVVAVHEIGHVLAAMLAGARVLGLGIGPLWLGRRRRGVRLLWRLPMKGTAGIAFAVPSFDRDVTRQMIAFAAGGPLSNLACAAGVFIFAPLSHGHPVDAVHVAVVAFGVQSLAIGLINLLPVGNGHVTDGAIIAAWKKGGAPVEAVRSVLAMYDASLRGILASEIPAKDIAALAEAPEIGMRFFGRYLALRAAQQRGDRPAFDACIQLCRDELARADSTTYDALRAAWAWFQVEDAFERACAGMPTDPAIDPVVLRRIIPAVRLRLAAANALAMVDVAAFDRLLAASRVEAEGEFDAATRRAEAALRERLLSRREVVVANAVQ